MPTSRLTIDVRLTDEERRAALLDDARRGLTSSPKALSPVWFYDEKGSKLFEDITELPEYYLTRAERGLLAAHSREIAEAADADTLIELGSGSSAKTRLLLDAMTDVGAIERFVPLDVSAEVLVAAATAIGSEYPWLEVHAVVGDFHRHLDALPAGGRRLVAFLGSTIGNLTPDQRRRFLFDLDCALTCDDHVLLGFDLVKAPERLVAAYDDAGGVTAAFNRNALRVLNDTLGATFEPAHFEHVAMWNAEQRWIEMHLRSSIEQRVRIDALDLEIAFGRGESVRTEISAKFSTAAVHDELHHAGFVVEQSWGADGDFLLVLARPYC